MKMSFSLLAALALVMASTSALASTSSFQAPSATMWLMLPIALALAVGLHLIAARCAKGLVGVLSPLVTAEFEGIGYDRNVYGCPIREMQEVVGLVLISGTMLWLSLVLSSFALVALGMLILAGAVALDVFRWERVSTSITGVWFQRGYGQTIHQIPISDIHDVTVTETDAPGITLRHLNRNRLCRLNIRLKSKHVVALPKTDAHLKLDMVEAVANHIRTRQEVMRAQLPEQHLTAPVLHPDSEVDDDNVWRDTKPPH